MRQRVVIDVRPVAEQFHRGGTESSLKPAVSLSGQLSVRCNLRSACASPNLYHPSCFNVVPTLQY